MDAWITNCKIYTEEHIFRYGNVHILDGKIEKIEFEGIENEKEKRVNSGECEIVDGQGGFLIPGMIDMHLHGCMGADACDGTSEALDTMATYQCSQGVTAFAPATMTLAVDELEKVLRNVAEWKKRQNDNVILDDRNSDKAVVKNRNIMSDLVGINMEGPFISREKKGAQAEQFILPCDTILFQRFAKASDGLLKVMGIAPEASDLEATKRFLMDMTGKVHISLAHTNADYDTANWAFDIGADHVTHLYNAMPALATRAPGVIAAAAEHENVTVELICDGVHVHPAMVRLAFRIFGAERIILISDSMRATGLADGKYTLGGQMVCVKGNMAVLQNESGEPDHCDLMKVEKCENITIAGSVTSLSKCLQIAVKDMGIPLEEVVRTVTVNPAKKLGIDDRYGVIGIRRNADLVLLDEELNVVRVWKSSIR